MPVVLCSKCATDLPEDADFCLKCGEPVKPPADAPPVAVLGCSKCGTTLPEGAEFCPKCGKPVSLPAKQATPKSASGVMGALPVNANPIEPVLEPARPLLTRRVVGLALLALALVFVIWAATSDSPLAQGVQELAGSKHDQSILNGPFTVSAHSFRYYKFSLPEGSMRVSIVGQFAASADTRSSSQRGDDSDSNIEVYVLSEPAFTVWQNGYATSSVYESGRVQQGSIDSEAPAGAGIYYLVFSNKFSTRTPKNVTASVSLRYKNWLPESLRQAKDRFWNWIGG